MHRSQFRTRLLAVTLLGASSSFFFAAAAHAELPADGAKDDRQQLLELMVIGNPPADTVARTAREVLARAQRSGDVSLQSLARGVECHARYRDADTASAKLACAEMSRLAAGADDLAVFAAERMKGTIALEGGQPVLAMQSIMESYAAAARSNNAMAIAAALLTLGSAAQFAGANGDAVDYYDRALSIAMQINAHGLRFKIANNLGVLLLETGDPAGARAQFEAAIEAAGKLPTGQPPRAALYGLAMTDIDSGDAIAAVARLRSLIDEFSSTEDAVRRGEAQLLLARAEFVAGDHAQAEAAARAAITLLRPQRPVRAYPAQALLVEILVAVRKLDEAERQVQTLLKEIPEEARGRVELLEAHEHLLLARGRYQDAYRAAVEARRIRGQQSTARSSRTLAFMRARATAEERSRELMSLREQQANAARDAQQARTVRNLSLSLLLVTLLGAAALAYTTSARRRLEAEVERRRNVSALGNLTGGVAHDFNNLMTIVRQSMALLRRDARVASSGSALSLIDEADGAAVLGGQITTQLLTFARQQPGKPEVVPVRRYFAERQTLFERALGDGMRLRLELPADDCSIVIDPAQLATAVINLLTNARDATAGRSDVVLRAETVINELRNRRWPELAPGKYVAISVIDQGSGMSEDVLRQATTPFFTTKDLDRGTGLGLSTVHGFVAQAGGALEIESKPGVGTSVRLVLPQLAGTAD